ncbi:CGNR zinc finger domain-containing protein [Frankia nepalensis]|nr:CGNR zinc finger domain-containing protein [Frankia nepalensis]MBL7513436.1 CGNR zinc finger domain-containing protein [Frankia nepalensis]
MPMRSGSGVTYWFDPGALCLELLTTGGPGPFARFETLRAPADLAAWAARSRLALPPGPPPALEIADADVADARRLRDALFRVAAEVAGDDEVTAILPVAGDDLARVNAFAARPPLASAAGPGGQRLWARPAGWSPRGPDAAAVGDGPALLATVARDAVDLLTGPYRGRIRACAGARCHLLYVDTSRPGRRRWCAMEHCGNRHKVAALRARRVPPPDAG